jgi:arginyl-tRNA synthetase
VLYRGGEKVTMSTRSGEFTTLRELREEVGNDAARYFYVMRSHDQHLDFDLDLAKSRANENPVFYIQYAHARIHSIFRQLDGRGLKHNPAIGDAALKRLTEDHERGLMQTLGRWPEIIEAAARRRAPHDVAHYLHDLAGRFHAYYNAVAILVDDDDDLRNARLNLISAVRHVIAGGLDLIGVSAPESM